MATTMRYGDYYFSPMPLLNYSVEYTYDADDELLYKLTTYSLTGSLIVPSGEFVTMMTNKQALEDALGSGNQPFVITDGGTVVTSGNPIVGSLSFDEGVWVNRIDYSTEMTIKDSSSASGNVESFVESWAFTEDENRRNVVVVHTVTAKGIDTSSSGNNALENAKTYALIHTGYDTAPTFIPAFTEGSGVLTAYSSLRTESADEAEKTYEITEEFVLSSGVYKYNQSATYDINEDGVASVTIEGDVAGLGRGNEDALTNAVVGWGHIRDRLNDTASGVYVRYGGGKILNTTPKSYSIGENSDAGIISFSYLFEDDTSVLPSGITDFTMTKSTQEPVKLYASHAIVNKVDGPVVQDLGTSTEGTVSLAGSATKTDDYLITDLKSYINTRIAAEAPTGYATAYRVTEQSYNIDETGNNVEFSVTWTFSAAAYSSFLTYLS